MRRAFLLLSLAAAACGEPVVYDNSAGNAIEPRGNAVEDVIQPVPVRIGELGPSFDPCTAAGTTRRLEAGGRLQVRTAPFDAAPESGAIPAGARFFVCTRSIDQKWFGVIYDDAGALAESCGVSEPVASRRDYAGPCRSGWVASAFVKLIAGVDRPPPNQSGAGAAPVPAGNAAPTP